MLMLIALALSHFVHVDAFPALHTYGVSIGTDNHYVSAELVRGALMLSANAMHAYVALTAHLASLVLHTALPAMIETAKLTAALTVLTGVLLAIPRTRRVAVAVMRFVKRHAPRWAIPLLIAAALFPGQADEMVIVPIVLLPILLNSRKRAIFSRYITCAWKA